MLSVAEERDWIIGDFMDGRNPGLVGDERWNPAPHPGHNFILKILGASDKKTRFCPCMKILLPMNIRI